MMKVSLKRFILVISFLIPNCLNSQPKDCNGEHTYCPISKQYSYQYCEGGKIVIKCTHRPEWLGGMPLRAPYPVCISFIDNNDAPSTFHMRDRNGLLQVIFNIQNCLPESMAAANDWNCLCDKQGQPCECSIKIVFSSEESDFEEPGGAIMESRVSINPNNCRVNCANSTIYVNNTDRFRKGNRTYTYNEQYQSVISNLADGYEAYNFRETILHELGHILGLWDYSKIGKQICPPGNGGVMNEFGVANATRQDFSNDDKCYFKNLYCGSYTTKVEEKVVIKNEGNQNFPNPFDSQTSIKFNVNDNSFPVKIQILNQYGVKIRFYEKYCEAGENYLNLDLSEFSSGVYYCQISTGNKSEMIKMCHVK